MSPLNGVDDVIARQALDRRKRERDEDVLVMDRGWLVTERARRRRRIRSALVPGVLTVIAIVAVYLLALVVR